jgi:bifunctional UDP-N-acetylglucosamine pyrophosphorylase/glucosamine-1-phosphate N-acetyltransferase
VVGRDADEGDPTQRRRGHEIPVTAVMQTERKGTGHAVLMARDIIARRF